MSAEGFDAIVFDRRDNVATAFRALAAGERVRITHPGGAVELGRQRKPLVCVGQAS